MMSKTFVFNKTGTIGKQDSQCKYNVNIEERCATTVVVKKNYVICVYL